jgi:hypothetical protein
MTTTLRLKPSHPCYQEIIQHALSLHVGLLAAQPCDFFINHPVVAEEALKAAIAFYAVVAEARKPDYIEEFPVNQPVALTDDVYGAIGCIGRAGESGKIRNNYPDHADVWVRSSDRIITVPYYALRAI